MKAVWEAITCSQPNFWNVLLQISFWIWDIPVRVFIGSSLQGGPEQVLRWCCRRGPGETFCFISSFIFSSWWACADLGVYPDLGEWSMVSLHKQVETGAWTHMVLWEIIKNPQFLWYRTGIHPLQALAWHASSTLELKWVNGRKNWRKIKAKSLRVANLWKPSCRLCTALPAPWARGAGSRELPDEEPRCREGNQRETLSDHKHLWSAQRRRNYSSPPLLWDSRLTHRDF